jgi:hypothetical protein
MVKRFKISIISILAIILIGCEKELHLDLPYAPSKLVVEGWIENGQPAQVILSHSAPFFSAIDSNTLMQFAETHAKVSVFSGTASEILTLKPNADYFPPLAYNSIELKGESGGTYSIEVILDIDGDRISDTVTAYTTIPEPVELDSVWFEADPGMGTKGRLWVRLTDEGAEANFYRLLYKRKGKDTKYIATNISTFSDVMINGKTTEMGFLRGLSSLISIEEENYFESGDTISVKFCTIDQEQFDFWNVYQSKVLASANPLASSNIQLKSNIKGGLGIWTGYGVTHYLVYAR